MKRLLAVLVLVGCGTDSPDAVGLRLLGSWEHVAPVRVTDLDDVGSVFWDGHPKRWLAQVEVEIRDGDGNPVPNIGVGGMWQRGFTSICNTGANGRCVLQQYWPMGVKVETIAVYDVGNESAGYAPALNSDPDGDSNGTSITVRRP